MKKAKFSGECWLWQYAVNKNGYGVLKREGSWKDAHKWLYELIKGKVPHSCELDHLCRNRKCVNPEHLEPVSHRENCLRGKQTKLTKEDVREIRRISGKHTQKEIAEKFGVSRASIGYILQGKRWI